MAKIDRILQLLESRIARGDYAMTPFPTEYGLADEMNVGRMTARRAILRLVEQGLMNRDSSGRLVVTSERSDNRPLHIGFVTATLTTGIVRWQDAAQRSVHDIGGHMRVSTYFHWDDPALLEVTDSFDGVFLVPPAEDLPPKLAEHLLNCRARVVLLGPNYSALGLRGVDVVSARSVGALLDHVAGLGHTQFALLNTQPVVPDIGERINQFSSWVAARHCGGHIINEPELSYGDPMDRAYRVAHQRLASVAGLGGTAVLCTTLPAALGLMRAANEHGLVIGRDVSICVVNDEGLAAFLSPTLTATRMSDPSPLLRDCLTWMAGGEWSGPLFKHSSEIELYVGRSTGPVSEVPLQIRLASSQGLTSAEQALRWNEKNTFKDDSLVDVG